jgi:hypothetical protein
LIVQCLGLLEADGSNGRGKKGGSHVYLINWLRVSLNAFCFNTVGKVEFDKFVK